MSRQPLLSRSIAGSQTGGVVDADARLVQAVRVRTRLLDRRRNGDVGLVDQIAGGARVDRRIHRVDHLPAGGDLDAGVEQVADAGAGAARARGAAEESDGVVPEARDVGLAAVGRDRDAEGLVDAVDAVLAVERRLDEDQRAAGHFAREDRDRVIVLGGDIDVLAVRAHRDRAGSVQPVDAGDAVLEALHQGELAEVVARRLDVAIEDQQASPRCVR